MSGVKTLVVDASKRGITAGIAAAIVESINNAGLDAVLSDSTP
jgi:menaquinone-dependent protoporphyrinogen IX oxidase